MDFLFDATADGRRLKFLNVIDVHSRLCLAIRVGRRCKAKAVVAVLEGLTSLYPVCSTTIWFRGRADLVDRSRRGLLDPVAMRRAPGHACSPHRSTDCAQHVQSMSRQPPGGGCRCGGHLGEQCPPD